MQGRERLRRRPQLPFTTPRTQMCRLLRDRKRTTYTYRSVPMRLLIRSSTCPAMCKAPRSSVAQRRTARPKRPRHTMRRSIRHREACPCQKRPPARHVLAPTFIRIALAARRLRPDGPARVVGARFCVTEPLPTSTVLTQLNELEGPTTGAVPSECQRRCPDPPTLRRPLEPAAPDGLPRPDSSDRPARGPHLE